MSLQARYDAYVERCRKAGIEPRKREAGGFHAIPPTMSVEAQKKMLLDLRVAGKFRVTPQRTAEVQAELVQQAVRQNFVWFETDLYMVCEAQSLTCWEALLVQCTTFSLVELGVRLKPFRIALLV